MTFNVLRIHSRRSQGSGQGAAGIIILMISLVFVPIVLAHVAAMLMPSTHATELVASGQASSLRSDTALPDPQPPAHL
jgi:hypothetical protein